MSKFNAKNLSYGISFVPMFKSQTFAKQQPIESNEPSFLRKLRGEFGGTDAVRHERPIPRPRKVMTDGDDEDQPTYVVEESQDTLSKEEYEALVRIKEDDVIGEGKLQTEDGDSALTTQPSVVKTPSGIEV